jgi:hypothetical protein
LLPLVAAAGTSAVAADELSVVEAGAVVAGAVLDVVAGCGGGAGGAAGSAGGVVPAAVSVAAGAAAFSVAGPRSRKPT